jgi:hypothetical protein
MGDPHIKVKLRGRHKFCLSFPFSNRAAAQSSNILDQISMPSNLLVAQPTIAQHGQGDRREHVAPPYLPQLSSNRKLLLSSLVQGAHP